MRTPALALLVAALTACAARAPHAVEPRHHDVVTARRYPPRAVVFRAPGFPTVDAAPISDETIDAALSGLPTVRVASAEALEKELRDGDVLVLTYGSAFPVDAWPRLASFLAHGGGLANLGGAPLHVPVVKTTRGFEPGQRAPTFAHELLVAPAEPITLAPDWKLDGAAYAGKTTWALTARLTRSKSFPDEHGSAGPRDAVLRPLAQIVDALGTPRACPLVEIDNVRGERAGSRWIFATTDAKLDAPAIHGIVARALEGASELRAMPVRASVERETPRIRLSRYRVEGRAHVVVTGPHAKTVWEGDTDGDEVVVRGALEPGLHRVRVSVGKTTAETGFWVKDAALLAHGPRVGVSRDWLRVEGTPLPVVGTTYMASDVHRDFLFEPNPVVWDADFQAMRTRGINLVRTGLWTAWSRVDDGGNIDEGVLAAFDAFVQTAARHGILVCFDFFAFLPPAYGASNPYLDERALAGQERFVRAFASRMKDVSWVHWDLINEPSYAPRAKLWKTRPIGDATEKGAFHDFVTKELHPGATDGALRALWRTGDPWATLRDEDLQIGAMQIDRAPRKAHDFRVFVESALTGWTARLARAVHEAAGNTLVTLGQDEGGIWERPMQQSFGSALDYTAVHTWWKNDDLLWDGVTTKLANKPNLHQETGLMRLEDLDGQAWRSPEASARLLARKVGYAFASRGAGVVEWVWNENPYMPIDEESTIGLLRPDGTAKPELDVLSSTAAFFGKAGPQLDDFEPDPVVLVLPHARVFLGYPNELAATRPVVRVLAERFGIAPRAVSDQTLSAKDLEGAKLVIVPAPDVLDEKAAAVLLAASRRGTKVLVTGPIAGDAYGRTTPSLGALGLVGPSRAVTMHERTPWSASGWVSFEGLAQETVRRADVPARKLVTTDAVWHEPLPLELAVEREPLVALLSAALDAARVSPTVQAKTDGVAVRVLLAPKAALVVAVNETPEPATRQVTVSGRPLTVTVPAEGTRLLLIDRTTGAVLVQSK